MWNASSLPPHGPLPKPQRGEAPLAPLVTCPVLPGPFRRSGTVSNRLRFAPRSRRMKADRTLTMRLLIVATLFGAVMYGDEITLPLDDGNIQIRAQFIRPNGYGSDVPELVVKIKNQTSSSWRTLKLQFDIGGLCNGEPRQWTIPVSTSLGWTEDHQLVKEYTDTVISLVGKVDGKTEIIRASLRLAENSKTRIDGVT